MKLKLKKPRWYNIFVVPEGRPAGGKYKIPACAPKVACVFAGVWVLFTLSLGGAMLYYRNGWLATEDVRILTEQVKEKEAHVSEKLASMEEMVGRADRLASRLEMAVGVDKKIMRKGIGPIPEYENLPDSKNMVLHKYELNSGANEDTLAAFNGLELKMDELNDTIASVELRLQDVYEYHKDKLTYWAAIPSIWPVRGWITSEFGLRRSPRGIGTRFHEGIDIAASTGTPVYASGDGVVTFAGYKSGLGKTIIIAHGFGISTVYGHNSQLLVKGGDKVSRGSSIAAVGRTGRSTGPHLHYQVEVDGMPVDPMRYIIENF